MKPNLNHQYIFSYEHGDEYDSVVTTNTTMEDMQDDTKVERQIAIFRRQYLQSLDPYHLTFPTIETLRLPEVQEQLFHTLFQDGSLLFPPPARFTARVLKLLIEKLEKAIVDPDEDVGFPYVVF